MNLPSRAVLTEKEYELVELFVVECLSDKEIAQKLKRSIYTIHTHRHNIHTKLDVHNTAELCKWYWTVDQYQPGL